MLKDMTRYTLRRCMSRCFLVLLLLVLKGANCRLAAQARTTEEGLCSYYSAKAHGHMMSSGERYDKEGYTCAHRTLPFGTRIRVTNTANGATTIVKVADRGPYGRTRVIDVSGAAARDLGMLQAGVARVRLEVLPSEFEILEERHRYRMSTEPEYLKQFQLDPPEMREELDWPDVGMPQKHTPASPATPKAKPARPASKPVQKSGK